MTFKGSVQWVEAHPTESIIIGGVGVIALLWLLGAFGGSKSTDSSGASSLAAAYYAAEAQQAVVGGQIQVANINATASTAQKSLDDNAAVAINSTNAYAAMTINGQNTSSAVSETYSNNQTAIATNQSNNDAAIAINKSNNTTTLLTTAMNTIIPTDQLHNSGGAVLNLGDFGSLGIGTDVNSPSYLTGAGYTSDQAQSILKARGVYG
jgi:hypothetical protein